MFFAGAWLGRELGVLLSHMASQAGFPSRYCCLGPRGGWFTRLPVLGHFARPRASQSRRAFSLELATAVAFISCWALFPPAKAPCIAILLLGLIGASWIDLDHMIIPDLFTIGLALAGLALSALVPALHGIGSYSAYDHARSFATALLGLGVGSALALWIAVLGEWILDKEVLGFGDVKFLGAIGAFCGWQGAVFSLFGGALAGAVALIAAEIHRRVCGEATVQLFQVESSAGEKGKLGLAAHFPFGPMLAVAATAYVLGMHPVIDRFLSCYAALFRP